MPRVLHLWGFPTGKFLGQSVSGEGRRGSTAADRVLEAGKQLNEERVPAALHREFSANVRDAVYLTLLRSNSRQGRLVMRHKTGPPLPEPIAQLQRQFEQFRSSHAHRTRLPESLWQAAVELARQHGLNLVAHPLRLDYTQLKKRLGEVAVAAPKRASVVTSKLAKSAAAASFVELIASPSATRSECVIEFESSIGGKMRIQWKGSANPDWAGLFRAWREAER